MVEYNAAKYTRRREIGCSNEQWKKNFRKARCSQLQLSSKFLTSVQQGITWLDLDKVESRYLISAGADASVAVYDTQAEPQVGHRPQADSLDPNTHNSQHVSNTTGHDTHNAQHLQPTFIISRATHPRVAPDYFVSCVAWYPVDSGLFVTGSYDHNVCVWDTNSLERVGTFKLPGKVSCLAMSSLASHCLVAACSLEPSDHSIKLCDPASGAFSHTLPGHREEVWTVAWSLQSEFQLLSGDRYGQMRLWDIRRAGCIHVYDQHTTTPLSQRTPPPPPPPQTTASSQLGPEVIKRRRTGMLSHSGSSGSDLARLTILPPDPRQSGCPGLGKKTSSSSDLGDRSSSLSGQGGRRTSFSHRPESSSGVREQQNVFTNRGDPSTSTDTRGGAWDPNNAFSNRGGPSAFSDASVRAHGGAITCVLPSPDTLHVFSAATDSRLKVWDVAQGHTLMVNYPNTFNRAIRARQMCCNEDGAVLFHPSGGVVQVLDTSTGAELSSLSQGHHESINCCVYNPLLQELYTGANDHQILVWQVEGGRENAGSQAGHADNARDAQEDNWDD